MGVKSNEVKLFLTFLLIYGFFIHWVGWEEDSRFALTRSIVENQTFAIDSYYHFTGDLAYYNGSFYSDKVPGLAFLGVPLHAFSKSFTGGVSNAATIISAEGGFDIDLTPSPYVLSSMIIMAFFVSSIFSALSVVLIYRISSFFLKDDKQKLLATAIYGTASLITPYGSVFFEHGMSAFFALLLVYSVLKTKYEIKSSARRAAIMGLLSGASVMISYLNVFVSVGVFVFMALQMKTRAFGAKSILIFTVFNVFAIAPLLIYNSFVFNNPLSIGYFNLYQQGKDRIFPSFVIEMVNEKGGHSLLTLVSGLLDFRPEALLYHAVTIINLLFSPFKGLFFYYPITLLAVPGLLYMNKKGYKPELWMIIAVSFLTLWVISLPLTQWSGGASFGPRFLILINALLFIPICFAIKNLSKKYKYIILALWLISALHNFIGFQSWDSETSDTLGNEYRINIATIDGYNYSLIKYNPIYEIYLPQLLTSGPKNEIFADFLSGGPIDIRGSIPSQTYSRVSGIWPFGILLINLRWLPFSFLVLLICLIWIGGKKPKAVRTLFFTLLFAIFFLLSLNLTNEFYDKNWYAKEDANNTYRWMRENATIHFFFQKNIVSRLNISLTAYDHLRTLELYINNTPEGAFFVGPGSDNVITPKLRLTRGENLITFKSSDGCTIPYVIKNSSDFRCLSFMFRSISFVSDDDIIRNGVLFSSGWYTEDQSGMGPVRWMSNRGTILAFSNGTGSLEINATSYRVPRNVSLSVNDMYRKSFIAEPDAGTKISVALDREGINYVTLDIDTLCYAPSAHENSTDERCISVGVLGLKKG